LKQGAEADETIREIAAALRISPSCVSEFLPLPLHQRRVEPIRGRHRVRTDATADRMRAKTGRPMPRMGPGSLPRMGPGSLSRREGASLGGRRPPQAGGSAGAATLPMAARPSWPTAR